MYVHALAHAATYLAAAALVPRASHTTLAPKYNELSTRHQGLAVLLHLFKTFRWATTTTTTTWNLHPLIVNPLIENQCVSCSGHAHAHNPLHCAHATVRQCGSAALLPIFFHASFCYTCMHATLTILTLHLACLHICFCFVRMHHSVCRLRPSVLVVHAYCAPPQAQCNSPLHLFSMWPRPW